MLKNRIKYWRHMLQFDKINEFADFLGFNKYTVYRWESQDNQPTLETLCYIREKIKTKIPEIKLDDLIEFTPDK